MDPTADATEEIPAAESPAELTGIHVSTPPTTAAGLPAVASTMKHVLGQAGLKRGVRGMARMNQKDGFDCPSCAWPDPDGERSTVEFCENGAKALASETTKARADAAFFAAHSIADLSHQSDYWMEKQGRIVEPMILRPGATHYEPLHWEDAFALIAEELNALADPNEAIFYTSGRTVNEAAFLYAVFARMFGTNNLPDCSNMCHESSGTALSQSIGVGKGTVTMTDLENADVILIAGQNPGTNHPRMLTTLQAAVRKGAEIVAINPMKEAGLVGFSHPQEIIGMLGGSTPLASRYLRVAINGDMALFRGLSKALLAAEKKTPGEVIARDFIKEHTAGFDDFVKEVEATTWEEIEHLSGVPQGEIEATAMTLLRRDKKVITCWAMGLTQHTNAVVTIREIANLHLLLGAIGRPGAGLCPVRGHSNVQGDRTVGIWERMPASYHDAIDKEFGFQSPREPGLDVVNSIIAMHKGDAKVLFAMGGNFLQATPDTEFTAEALRKCSLTAHVSTKLNRSHLVTGRTAIILPCLGRSEEDVDSQGELRFSTVENSMGVVHQSKGTLIPAAENLLSETTIVARLAEATLGDKIRFPFVEAVDDYDRIRDIIERVIPGFDNFNEQVRHPGGFYLPNAAKQRVFNTPNKKANFCSESLSGVQPREGELMLMTVRSHDQFNTTIYGLNDRYRGIGNERRILFMHPEDMAERDLKPLAEIDIVNEDGGRQRIAHRFLAIPYDLPRGATAGYFPELNVLVPIGSTADGSNTPCSKSVPIQVRPAAAVG